MLFFSRKLLLLLVLFSPTLYGNEQSGVEEIIQQIFPKATVIGEKEDGTSVPVWPVYQLGELIGYAFESNDMVDFPGFSGARINLLIGIETSGEIAGISLLHHHEPIFLHGLGPQPFLDFIAQYEGHSVADRIIVGHTSGGRDDSNIYIDGVTKATVSVIVANDTILNSALKVARAKLEEYAQRAPAVVREDYFEALDFNGLLASGLVKQWHITAEEVEGDMGSALADFPDQELKLTEGDQRITLYYAYLNPPTVGRNLLGEAEYEELLGRLKPGEHAFAIMSEGFYSYLPPDYRPGTVPDRISLLQNGLPINIRDTNFYEAGALPLVSGAPQLPNLRVFRTRPQAGLDPSAPMQIQLKVQLAKNHLVSQSSYFTDEYTLPETFFKMVELEDIAPTQPIWVRIWQSRATQIAVLLTALLILTINFARQRKLTNDSRRFHLFRLAFLSFTLLFIGFYAQGQLSIVNIFTVQLALRDGFNIDVFLLDPVIFILWLYTFISLFLVGRGLFCGWLCPFGALQEALAWLAARLGITQIKVHYNLHRRLLKIKYIILLGLVGLAFYSLGYAEKAAEVEPFKTVITLGFIREWPFAVYAVIILGMGLFIHKFYCRYLCPLGAALAILGKFHLFGWLDRRKECGSPCQLCRHRCEIGAIRKTGEIDYDECIQCLECIVILQDVQQCAPEKAAQKRAMTKTRPQVISWEPDSAQS